jgi:hypothetical protein
MLLLPTKFCARLTMVECRLASPWWYAECSDTYPESWATCGNSMQSNKAEQEQQHCQHCSGICKLASKQFNQYHSFLEFGSNSSQPPELRRGMLHISWTVADLDVLLQVPLEGREHDLALAWLEAIHHGGNGALQIGPGEKDKLLNTQEASMR